jgi:endoglucanase
MKKLLLLFWVAAQSYGAQLLTNHEFLSGRSGWDSEGAGSFSIVPGSDSYGSHLDINISNGGSNPWDVKLFQNGITLRQGYEYVLEWGASRESGSITVGVGLATDPWTDYLSDQISFSGDYLDHTVANNGAVVYKHCSANVSGLRFYMDLGGSSANARIAWVSLSENPTSCGGSTSNPTTGSTSIGAVGSGPVPYYGELKVSGNRIIGSKTGTATQVKGMSLYWSIWGGEKFYNANVVNQLVDFWNVELVRAAMAVDEPGGYISHAVSQQYYVEDVVDAAIAKGIYVIIDFHSHNANNYTNQARTFFTAMAQKYGHHDNVIFEIFNEPIYQSWSQVKTYATSVISAIRAHSDNLVIVGTPNWSQDVDIAANDKINDPNTAYGFHFYAGTHGADLRNKALAALGRGAALFCSEWGTVNADGDGGVNASASDAWLGFLDQNKISWANWSIVDIAEGSAALKPGTANTGLLNTTSAFTTSGNYVYNKLRTSALNQPWRTVTPILFHGDSYSRMQLLGQSSTGFLYSLPSPQNHQIRVYDMKGKIIEQKYVLEDSFTGEFVFNDRLRPGLYSIEITSDSFKSHKPLVLTE